jgi:hypothetical protein
MNMISTGAFQTEMDASSRQPTLAEKFAAVWEKKNAKAARAGGVSLMALSLAACGSDDSTTTSSSTSSTTTTTTTTAASQSFALTTGIDSVSGDSGNDTIAGGATSAATQTLNTLDSIDGGAGTDSLSAVLYSNATPGTTDVETYNISANAAATLDLSGSTGVTSITNTGSTNLLTVTNIGADVDLTLSSTASGGTFNYAASTVTGTADAKTVVISGVTGGTLNMGTGVETLTVNSIGSANTLAGLTTSATTLNITGSSDLSINAAGELTAQTTIDASASTGSISLQTDTTVANSITTGSGNDSITADGTNAVVETISTGTGNDTVTFDANLANADVVDGGAGTDTLVSTFALLDGLTNATAATDNISNFEKVTFTTTFTAGQTFNVASVQTAGITTVTTDDAAGAGASTINFYAGASTLNLAGVIGGQLNVDAAATALDDALTINVTDSGADAINGQAIVSTDYETLTISTSGTGLDADQTLGAVTMTASTGGTTAVSFTGDNAIDGSGIITAATIDFSGITDADGVVMGAAAAGVTTITGSAGNDTLRGDASSTINAGDGNDTILSGSGADTITTGAGDDGITSSAGNDSVDMGSGNDTYTLDADADMNAADSIDAGEGTADVLHFTASLTDSAAGMSSLKNFEVLRVDPGAADTITLTNFTNSTFTRIDLDDNANSLVTLNNLGTGDLNIRIYDGANNIYTLERTADTATDSAVVTSYADNSTTDIADLQMLDEETITIGSSASTSAIDIDDLIVADLTTLNITGSAGVLVNIEDTIQAGGTDNNVVLATVDASTATGIVTLDNEVGDVAMSFTGNATNGGVIRVQGTAFADTIKGGSAGDTLLEGNGGNDTIYGYGGADTITGNAGNDTIYGGSGNDEITAGAGADVVYADGGTDDINIGDADSVAASATSLAAGTIAAGDTLTFANGVDLVYNWTAGTDNIATGDGANIAVTAIGATANALAGAGAVADINYFLSGTYNTGTSLFTINADGVGADMLIMNAQDPSNNGNPANDDLSTITNITIFIGVDTDDIAAGDFVA